MKFDLTIEARRDGEVPVRLTALEWNAAEVPRVVYAHGRTAYQSGKYLSAGNGYSFLWARTPALDLDAMVAEPKHHDAAQQALASLISPSEMTVDADAWVEVAHRIAGLLMRVQLAKSVSGQA